jgi:hypothetical protein
MMEAFRGSGLEPVSPLCPRPLVHWDRVGIKTVILSPDAPVRAQSGKKPRHCFAVILSPDARVRARSGKKRLLV